MCLNQQDPAGRQHVYPAGSPEPGFHGFPRWKWGWWWKIPAGSTGSRRLLLWKCQKIRFKFTHAVLAFSSGPSTEPTLYRAGKGDQSHQGKEKGTGRVLCSAYQRHPFALHSICAVNVAEWAWKGSARRLLAGGSLSCRVLSKWDADRVMLFCYFGAFVPNSIAEFPSAYS